VTNRLVGGPVNVEALEDPQSGGMGEGWGDYVACTITNGTVVGAWVVNQPGGIRGFPYDSNFPDNFGDLGTGRYDEVHNTGEIWCATLLEMNRKVGAKLGVQLVVDALKLSPANPSFLDMRDAILAALDNKLAGPRRLLYGSDYPHNIGDMAGCADRITALPIDETEKDLIRSGNARRLFKL
jgi:extracellular elastinolytic metalloproteinase